MREIPLHGSAGLGKVALVDDGDVQLVAPYKWYWRNGYAVTAYHRKGANKGVAGRTINISMHRLILGFPEGQVDHRNRNRLDNQRGNLRLATMQQNNQNIMKSKKSAAGFLGVKQESLNVFCARVGKVVVGYYDAAEKAAIARDQKALELRGEFAVLNFSLDRLTTVVQPLPPRNTGPRTSATRGVSYAANRKAKAKWRAVCKKNHLGWYLTEMEAAQALEEYKRENQIS